MIAHFGLDIGSDTIKVAQVSKEKDKINLISVGFSKTPGSGMLSDSDKDLATVGQAVKQLKEEAKISAPGVVLAIPDRNVFNQVIELPKMTEGELEQAIPWEAEHLVPQPLSEVNLDWEVIDDDSDKSKENIKVFLVAVSTNIVKKYIKVIKAADLEPVALETETLSTIRCLKPIINKGNLVIVNLGVKSAEIIVLGNGKLFLTRSLPASGEAITRAIGSSLNLEINVAEEYKKNYGLSNQMEGKVKKIIEPVLGMITNEIKKAIHFFEEKEKAQINLMILCGGTSLLPGLTEYFTKSLGVETQIADPFSLFDVSRFKDTQNIRRSSPLFVNALGLAMREK